MIKVRTMQHPDEHAWFCDILRRENVRSYLEIGCLNGGSLQDTAYALPRGSRVVGVELAEPYSLYPLQSMKEVLALVVADLRDNGYAAEIVWGDSKAMPTIAAVSRLAPFDAIFIDGDHRLEGVRADWINFGPLARLVAFHDVAGPGKRGQSSQDVPQFWDALKGGYRHEEKKLGTSAGIGVLWRS